MKTDIMELLDEELQFEGLVTQYLNGLRAGCWSMPVRTRNECRAFEVAIDDFRVEMEHLITRNGERLP